MPRDEHGRRLLEEIHPTELEIREIEERLYRLGEQHHAMQEQGLFAFGDFDAGMLCAARTILDGFLGGDEARDAWIQERDGRRANERLLGALGVSKE